MATTPIWIPILVSSLLSAIAASALTVAATFYYFDRKLRPEIEREVEERLETARVELATLIQHKVRQGVIDGITSLPTPEGVRGATQALARGGAELVARGLSGLLGDRPKE